MNHKAKAKKKICQELKCKNEATKEFRNIDLCLDCYTKLVYDMQPLALKKEI